MVVQPVVECATHVCGGLQLCAVAAEAADEDVAAVLKVDDGGSG